MRVHASLRDNVRLWIWAAGGTLFLFTVIVVLGIAPSPFPSISLGDRHSSPTLVLPGPEAAAAVYPHDPATLAARGASSAPVRNDVTRPSRRGRVTTQPAATTPTNRAAPKPVGPTQTQDPKPVSSAPTPPASAPAQSAPSEDPTVSVPLPTTTPDPLPPVPTLPAVTTPPVVVGPVTVPSVSLP